MNDNPGSDAARAVLKKALLWSIAVLFVLVLAAAQLRGPEVDRTAGRQMAMFFAMKQDIPVGAMLLVLLAALLLGLERTEAAAASAGRELRLTGLQAGLMLVAMALGIWLVRGAVLPDYDMTRDEQMVTFDAAIFARGHLFEPIPAAWRQFYEALNVVFILPIGDREAWVSGYLPGNAALRALLSLVVPASAVGALLVLVGGAVLWRIALRLWPDSSSTRAVVLVLFVSSSQIILTGTSTYAMSAHMTVNIVWLWLFLKRTPLAQAGAIAVGFLATGLHQPLFHPLFVGPFMLILMREKAWKEFTVYFVCYGLIGLFWIGWQPWVSGHGLHPVPAAHSNDGTNYLERFSATRTPFTQYSFWVMAENLLRFAAWQNFLLMPLMAVPLLGSRRFDPLVMALWLGMVLVVVFMTIVLPAQINGWGYRYLHGFLGAAILLAGFGWNWLEQRSFAPFKGFAAATALSLLVLPVHLWMAAGQIGANADAARRVRSVDADVVVVDEGVPFAADLVLNRADLSNRPILLGASGLKPSDMGAVCAGRSLAFGDAPLLGSVSRFFRIPPPAQPTPHQAALKAAAVAAGCRIVPTPYPAR